MVGEIKSTIFLIYRSSGQKKKIEKETSELNVNFIKST